MKKKLAIVTDSASQISEKELKELDVYLMPIMVEHNGVEYNGLTDEEFYNLDKSVLPKTSQPNLYATMQLFEQLEKEYENVLIIHLSSEISGTYQTTCSLTDYDFNLFVFDSKTVLSQQAQLVREAVRLKELAPLEIIDRLNKMIEKQDSLFLVDDLMHLQKGGRLSKSSAIIGSMLNVKPILNIKGSIEVVDKVRTSKKAMNYLVENIKVDKGNLITILHCNCLEKAEELKSKLNHKNIEIQCIGYAIGTHLGEGSIGVMWTPVNSEYL